MNSTFEQSANGAHAEGAFVEDRSFMRIAAALTLLILAMLAASAVVPVATVNGASPFAAASHAG